MRGWTAEVRELGNVGLVFPGVRGWTANLRPSGVFIIVFPRRARVDRDLHRSDRPWSRFPPACGGGPTESQRARGITAFSPGVRGWTAVGSPRLNDVVLFPRRTGVDRCRWASRRQSLPFPPAYGGGPVCRKLCRVRPSFSPGVRGWTAPSLGKLADRVLFPRRTGVDQQ